MGDNAGREARGSRTWRRELAVFLVVTYATTWLLWLPLVISPPDGEVMSWNYYAASSGPLIGGVAAAGIHGRGSIRFWLVRSFHLRRTGSALALVGISLAVYLAIALTSLAASGSGINSLGMTAKLPGVSGMAVATLWLLTFGLGEEAGWRGWLTPHLMERFGFLTSSFVVTGIWLSWHIPAFFFNPTYTRMGLGVLGWIVALLAGSIWLGWLSRSAGWSVVPVIVWHGGFDAVTASDLLPAVVPAAVSALVILQAIAVVIFARRSGSAFHRRRP